MIYISLNLKWHYLVSFYYRFFYYFYISIKKKFSNVNFFISGSALTFGSSISVPISGLLLHKYGQKLATQIAIVIAFLSWVIMYITPYVSILIFSRVTHGLSVVIITASCCLHIVETATDYIRNVLIASVNAFRYMGPVFIFGIGYTEMSWRLQALICCFVGTVPSFITFMFLPTSPRYLARMGKIDEAEKALQFYRGKNFDIRNEMMMIKKVFLGEEKLTLKNQMKYLMRPKVLKYLAVLFVLAFGTEMSGKTAILIYLGPIIQEAIPEADPFIWSLIISFIRVIGCSLFGFMTSFFPRRSVYLVSCLSSVSILVLFGTYLYTNTLYDNSVFPWWVPIFCLCALMLTTSISVPLCLMLVGEILPTNCRSLGYAIVDLSFYMTYFISILTFTWLKKTIYFHGVIWMYAIVHFTTSWIPLIFLPETKGKNLEEIQIKLFS